MAAIQMVNPKAEYAQGSEAFLVNLSAARGLEDIMKTNLGPKGTMKMLISGAGDVRMTKHGGILLTNIQINHPTASLIARTSTAMDAITGDGSTSTVILIGEILKRADSYLSEGVHPRMIAKGLALSRTQSLDALDSMKIPFNREKALFRQIAESSLKTKLPERVAHALADVCAEAIATIYHPEGDALDLNMIEIMVMQHGLQIDTRLVKGLVLDHGARHHNMPKSVSNAYILACNVSLEYEKTEVNSSFFYKSAEERERLVQAEREFVDRRVQQIIDFKRKVCDGTENAFVVINQKGIDPFSLEALSKEGIVALRRAKRRNMERLMLACGGTAMNCLDDLSVNCLGKAGKVYEHVLGETKYTFVTDCPNPKSATILINGPATYATKQIEEAVQCALKAMKNAVDDSCVLPGGGAVEVILNKHLLDFAKTLPGKERLGVQVLADSLLAIPRTLARNSGFDPVETVGLLEFEAVQNNRSGVGLDLTSGKPMNPLDHGIYDGYCVKRQSIASAIVLASNILLTDDILRAGLTSVKGD